MDGSWRQRSGAPRHRDCSTSYTAERHPIGAWALNWTRAQVAVMRPDPYGQAVASVIRDLIQTRDGATYFAHRIAGAWLRYDLPGRHPLIGRSVPDFAPSDGTRPGRHLEDGKALLANLAPDANGRDPLRMKIAPWADNIGCLAERAKDTRGLAAVLIRPDGFVCWASDEDTKPDLDALAAAAGRCFLPAHERLN